MRRLIFTLTLTFALLPAAAALASGSAVIRDCTDDGRLQGHYSQRDLRDALNSIPSDVDEYTNCRDVIRRAAFNGAGGAGGGSSGGGGGASSGGGAPGGEFGGFGDGGGGSSAAGQDPLSGASPAERKAIDAVRLGKAGPLRFSDGSLIRPGALTRHAGTDVPAPLLVAVAAQSVAAVPYYRDDACFDDGTGSDPGPELHPRHFADEQKSTASDGSPRRCWAGDPKVPGGDDRFWQGDIGTHGLHLLFLAESDNARLTVPVTEIVSQWQMVMLRGDAGNVGERYGRSFEKPLVAFVR